jgi:hypothetical protein
MGLSVSPLLGGEDDLLGGGLGLETSGERRDSDAGGGGDGGRPRHSSVSSMGGQQHDAAAAAAASAAAAHSMAQHSQLSRHQHHAHQHGLAHTLGPGPDESESDVLPFALDCDLPAPLGGVSNAANLGGARGGTIAGTAAAAARERDLEVCAFIRSMQDAPPLCSQWPWGCGVGTVGDALLAVEQLAARLQPVLLPPR